MEDILKKPKKKSKANQTHEVKKTSSKKRRLSTTQKESIQSDEIKNKDNDSNKKISNKKQKIEHSLKTDDQIDKLVNPTLLKALRESKNKDAINLIYSLSREKEKCESSCCSSSNSGISNSSDSNDSENDSCNDSQEQLSTQEGEYYESKHGKQNPKENAKFLKSQLINTKEINQLETSPVGLHIHSDGEGDKFYEEEEEKEGTIDNSNKVRSSGKQLETLILEDDFMNKDKTNYKNNEKDDQKDKNASSSPISSAISDPKIGSYVRMTPVGIESKLMEHAKNGYSQKLQSAGINSLMRVEQSNFCDNITQDPITNPNYNDKCKTNTNYVPDNERYKYMEDISNSWIEESFVDLFKNSETMALLEQYEQLEKTLEQDNERKKIHVKTEIEDLPKISASYIMDFLREPIPELHERWCIAGEECVSFLMHDYLKMNSPLTLNISIPTDAQNKTNTFAQQKVEKFILREFLLPRQKAQLELEVNLGTPIKEVLNNIERKHCILCNRFWTSIRASRIASGIKEIPKNTIQDHCNYFNCIGEYPKDSMLCFSGDYCGIIGKIVEFNYDDYALGTMEYKYNTTTQEDRMKGINHPDKTIIVKCWVEKRIITHMQKHDEGK